MFDSALSQIAPSYISWTTSSQRKLQQMHAYFNHIWYILYKHMTFAKISSALSEAERCPGQCGI